jgi:hypothetical protein
MLRPVAWRTNSVSSSRRHPCGRKNFPLRELQQRKSFAITGGRRKLLIEVKGKTIRDYGHLHEKQSLIQVELELIILIWCFRGGGR